MNDEFSQRVSEQLYAEQMRLLSDDLGRAVQQSLEFGCAEAFELDLLSKRVHAHKIEMARCPFPDPQTLDEGNFVLGYDLRRGRPLKIPLEWMGCPGLICGSTGSGKTNAAKFWALQFGILCPGAWFIDCRKREMRALIPLFERAGCTTSLIDTHSLKINPLEVPEHVSPHSYVGNISDGLIGSLGLSPGSRKIVHQTLYALYQRHGMFEGNTENYPTLFEFREAVAGTKHFHPQARDALVTALDPLLMSLRHTLAFRKGWSLRALAKQRIVFELASAAKAGQDLLSFVLLFSECQSRVALGYSNVRPSLFVYLDESSSILESDTGTSELVGIIRGLGQSLMLSNQSAVTISQRILSNIPNRFLAQCSSFADLNAIGSAMGLDAVQKRYLAQNLTPGLMLAGLANGSWRKPFLFTTPLMDTDGAREPCGGQIAPEIASLPVIPAPFHDWMPEWARYEVVNSDEEGPKAPAIEQAHEPAATVELDPGELRLLTVIVAEPCQAVSTYPEKVRMSKRRVRRLRESLVSKRLIQEQTVQTSGRGRPSILLAPTAEGVELLAAANDSERR